MTVGVFPVPPAFKLPTQITGMGADQLGRDKRRDVPYPYSKPNGESTRAQIDGWFGGVNQNLGGRITLSPEGLVEPR